ncbi:MAG TPA: DUF2461 domain-containing protein [Candidatus Angelobacter sp.]|nr:DUF2461 domain-containing protein [Candidatus Angelobacter sp.]
MAQVSLVPSMKRSFQGFSPDALTFLRALKRNNRREWFQPRKEKFEMLIKAPMLELIECLNQQFVDVAPQYITPPQKAVYRIYRDTRFSKDKTPYKTHVSAIFPRSNAVKREGAVFYFHFTEKELLIFGGVWAPERDELLAYRTLLAEHHEEFRQILTQRELKRVVGSLQGEQMSRVPKGFPVDHPAESLLRHRQWYLESTVDAKLITSPKVVPEIARRFAAMAPMVEFLNRPFAHKEKRKKMLFAAF